MSKSSPFLEHPRAVWESARHPAAPGPRPRHPEVAPPDSVVSATETTGLAAAGYPEGSAPATHRPSPSVEQAARRHRQTGR